MANNKYLQYSTLGLNLAVGFALFVFLGSWLDNKFHHEFLFTLLGVGLGMFYGGYEIWKLLKDLNS